MILQVIFVIRVDFLLVSLKIPNALLHFPTPLLRLDVLNGQLVLSIVDLRSSLQHLFHAQSTHCEISSILS